MFLVNDELRDPGHHAVTRQVSLNCNRISDQFSKCGRPDDAGVIRRKPILSDPLDRELNVLTGVWTLAAPNSVLGRVEIGHALDEL